MDLLVGNGSSLYRRNGSLVRTPIRITLNPDSMSFCPIGNVYNFQNSSFQDIFGNRISYETLPSGKTREDAAYDAKAEAVYGEYTMANNWGANGWRSAQYDMGATLYYGGFDPTAIERYEQNYYMNYSASAFMCLAAYHFTIPQSMASLTVNDVESQYYASRASHFGSMRNSISQQSAGGMNAYGRLGTNVSVTPSSLMSALSSEGYHLRFQTPTTYHTNQGRVIWWYQVGSNYRELVIPTSSSTGPYTGNVTNGNVTSGAVDFRDGNRSFYLFIFHNWNAGARPPTPNNLSSAPLWWAARHVFSPRLIISLGG